MLTRLFFIFIALIFMWIIISRVKKKKFFEKESFLWVIGSVFALILSVFPGIIGFVSQIVGIQYPPSLLFLLTIIFVLFLLFRQGEQISLLREQVKDLGQRIVVLEKIIEEEKRK